MSAPTCLNFTLNISQVAKRAAVLTEAIKDERFYRGTTFADLRVATLETCVELRAVAKLEDWLFGYEL